MQLSAVVVDVDPDPIAIAQRFSGRPGFAFLHTASGRGGWRRSFVAVDPLESSAELLPPPFEAHRSSLGLTDTRAAAPRWIGAIPYECARSLERPAWVHRDVRPEPHLVAPRWWRYGAVVEIDALRDLVRVIGDEPARVAELARELRGGRGVRRPPGFARLSPRLHDEPPSAHVERVRQALALIAAGDLYQVNLARRLSFSAEGQPLDLYLAMAKEAPAPFGACLDLGDIVLCANSPELFLELAPGGRLTTGPIKGTRPRGLDALGDARLIADLDQSLKEQAELTMILDVERNDLGRVARTGSVRVLRAPTVDTHRSVHHRAAVLGAQLALGKGPLDALAAMFPSGSVTGAPKVRAMEVIAELEPVRRGLYTGAFGAVAWDGSLTLAMAIRVLTLREHEAHYFSGGGIVADSDPEAELAETRWKAAQLAHLTRG